MYPKNGSKTEDTFEDENFYSREKRERLIEEDALRYEEDGFMQGYEDDFFEESIDESWLEDLNPEGV